MSTTIHKISEFNTERLIRTALLLDKDENNKYYFHLHEAITLAILL